jgi:hypothetical protein
VSGPPRPHRPVDPVRSLLHRHRDLCERAVDPLEIAAALEAQGITDRTAAGYRHRDVFSLAEELYARTPRADGTPAAPARPDAPRRGRGTGRARAAGAALFPLLPGGLCAAVLAAPALTGGLPAPARTAVAVAGTLLVLLSVRACLRGTALNRAAVLGSCWLVGYALAGDRLLAWALGGGAPAAVHPAERYVPLGLALAVAPAVWCARWFAARARLRLGASRSLEEFAARTRSLLAAAVALFATGLLAALAAAYAAVDGVPPGMPPGGVTGPAGVRIAAAAALGILLFTALLLAAHGFPAAAAGGIAAACVPEAAALAAATASRWPGPAFPGRSVEALAAAWGPAAVPALACACAALALLVLAASSLAGASAHHWDGP